MESEERVSITELRLSYHYIKEQPWAMTAVNGLLAAYFIEQPSFRSAFYASIISSLASNSCPQVVQMS
jgi:hypothetical protein